MNIEQKNYEEALLKGERVTLEWWQLKARNPRIQNMLRMVKLWREHWFWFPQDHCCLEETG